MVEVAAVPPASGPVVEVAAVPRGRGPVVELAAVPAREPNVRWKSVEMFTCYYYYYV